MGFSNGRVMNVLFRVSYSSSEVFNLYFGVVLFQILLANSYLGNKYSSQ